MKASQKFKTNKYTSANFEHLPDGSVRISLYDPKATGKKHLAFRVKNLNKDNEQIIEDEEE